MFSDRLAHLFFDLAYKELVTEVIKKLTGENIKLVTVLPQEYSNEIDRDKLFADAEAYKVNQEARVLNGNSNSKTSFPESEGTHWNYRVVHDQGTYKVVEVYYSNDGEIRSWCDCAVTILNTDSYEDLKSSARSVLDAFDKVVIEQSELDVLGTDNLSENLGVSSDREISFEQMRYTWNTLR